MKFARANAFVIFVCALPLVLLALDGSFLANRPGDGDTWFYYGHFTSLGQYRNVEAPIPFYYQSRLAFILPGWLIFTLFSPIVARIVHYYLYYVIICGSLMYVLSRNTSRMAAMVATIMLGTDIYFLRSAGWNYVDIGVLCYVSLAFVALTIASRGEAPMRWVAVAAFCFTCAVITHLEAALCIIPVAGYALYALQLERAGWRRFVLLSIAAIAGVVLCLVVFGLLNVWIWHADFFFLRYQLDIARGELRNPSVAEPLSRLIEQGGWLTMHVAALVVSLAMLAAAAARLVQLNRFRLYCFGAIAILFVMCPVLEQLHLAEVMGRSGLYVTFFMFSTYLAIGAALPADLPPRLCYATALAFVAALVVRLNHGGGAGLPFAGQLPVWAVGVLIGAMLLATALVRSRVASLAGLVAVAALSLGISWRFDRDDTVYAVHDIVSRIAGKSLPRLMLDRDHDPLYYTTISSIIGSFTERAYWLTSWNFPRPKDEDVWLHEKVFVLTSKVADNDAVRDLLKPQVDELTPLAFMHFKPEGNDLWIHGFDVVNRISLPIALEAYQSRRAAIPAAALPSKVGRVDGDMRIATAGETEKGILTAGPLAKIAPGMYDVLIQYSATSDGNAWSMTVNDGRDAARPVQSGKFANTSGEMRDVHVTLTFPGTAIQFQVITFYQGIGTFAVKAVGLRARD